MACRQLLRPSPRALKLSEVIHTTLALEYVKWNMYNEVKSLQLPLLLEIVFEKPPIDWASRC